MAKLTTADGSVFEGTVAELAQMLKEFGVVTEEQAEGSQLSVGDYAKVVGGFDIHLGKIAKVTEIDSNIAVLDTIGHNEMLSGSHVDHLVKATDEEVAEAKRKLAEKEEAEATERKWAAINRKPNEYKVGDIVGYKFDGEKCEVIEIGKGGLARVKTVRHGICAEKDDIELITPVEHRFDK